MAHYPPYTSKWNPIERKLFPHVTRAMSGVVFKNHELVRELIGNTHTEQGLKVTANIIDKVYETGKRRVRKFCSLPLWLTNFSEFPSSGCSVNFKVLSGSNCFLPNF
jgi:hypothetical protein